MENKIEKLIKRWFKETPLIESEYVDYIKVTKFDIEDLIKRVNKISEF